MARVEAKAPIAGRRQITGRIVGANDAGFRIAVEEGEVGIPFAEVSRAKLLLTDELIAATASPPPRH